MKSQDPKTIFGRRLEQARRMRGLSLRALSEATGGKVSYNALHRYERGEMMPGDDVLIPLADALDRSLDFFFRPFSVRLKGVEFRKTTGLRIKAVASIQEQAADYFERYLEIEQVLGLPLEFHDPLGDFRLRGPEDAEEAAKIVRSQWGLGADPLPNVVETLETNGIKVFEAEAPERLNGFSGWADGHPVVALAAWLNRDLPRKRFTALHEAAHLLIHAHTDLRGKDLESCCHRFAGAMLIPQEAFERDWGGYRRRISLEELIGLKRRYGTSIGAIMHRALDLGLIDAAAYKRFVIAYKSQRWHQKEPGEYTGVEKSNRFEQLVFRAAAEEFISLAKGAALLNRPVEDFGPSMDGFA
ncbi:MAG: XRE family transcriptional regulator [Thermodesulfobacteriota bacterium]